jgi:hypothetical protein
MWVLVRVSWIGCGLLAFSLGNFFGLGGGGGGGVLGAGFALLSWLRSMCGFG